MHVPVLQKEVLEYLESKPNENFVDATLGQAGHTLALLDKNKPEGKVLGIEVDPDLCQKLKPLADNFQGRLILVNDSYQNLKKIVENYKFGPIHGILFDLGLSSWHLEESGRGFSFQKQEPLIMGYNPEANLTAETIINDWPEQDIKRILKDYGQERFAARIARGVCLERKSEPIKTTFQLVKIIKKSTPGWYHGKKIHFATRTFQALRIAVNNELNNLRKVLPQALEVLEKEGRLAVISFHSLEDTIVKNSFSSFFENQQIEILTEKPITPSEEEVRINPRSRSAKLRAAVKI